MAELRETLLKRDVPRLSMLRHRGGQDLGDFDASKPGGGSDWDTTPQVPEEVEFVATGTPHPPKPPGGYGAAGAGGGSVGGPGGLGGGSGTPQGGMQSLALARAPAAHVVPYDRRGPGSEGAAEEGHPGTKYSWANAARVFKQVYIAQVGKFQFRLLHRLEGRWNGDAQVLTAAGTAPASPRVVAVGLKWDDDLNVWEETQSITDAAGMASAQTLQLIPVADGVCKVVQKGTSAWGDVDMELREESAHVLLLTATSHATGKPILVETVTVVDDMRRVRTVQRFDTSGAFQCLYCFKERRVIDAVTGALVPGMPGTPTTTTTGQESPAFTFPHSGVHVAETDEEGGSGSPSPDHSRRGAGVSGTSSTPRG